jgi:hypothetical protein
MKGQGANMATQAELDEMISKSKAVLYAINPAYVPEDKKPLRNSAVTFKQVDLTGEQPVNDLTDCCSVCASPLLNLRGDLFGAGRPSVYCSNACKMKAYRKRSKSLRNVQHQTEQKSLPVSKRSNVIELSTAGKVIGISGTVHKFPIKPLTVIKVPAPYIRSFNDLKSFFGGGRS